MNTRQQGTSGIGKGMIIAAWVLLLVLLSVFFGDLLEKQHNPNPAPDSVTHADGLREVLLLRNRLGHYVATGSINGQPVAFLLDTGATNVSVPAGLARRLQLARGASQRVQTANGTVITYATRLAEISLGDIQLHEVRANINPGMSGQEVLLGMSFLKQLEFTQRGNTLTLRQYP